jgi:hypothetical protein
MLAVRTDIVALGENSISVQYPGCRAAILGVIHHHRSDTSFNFTPEIYSRIESQKRAFALGLYGDSWFKINEHGTYFPSPLHHQRCASAIGSALDVLGPVRKHTYGFGGAYPRLNHIGYEIRTTPKRQARHAKWCTHDGCKHVREAYLHHKWNWTLLLIYYDESLTL